MPPYFFVLKNEINSYKCIFNTRVISINKGIYGIIDINVK